MDMFKSVLSPFGVNSGGIQDTLVRFSEPITRRTHLIPVTVSLEIGGNWWDSGNSPESFCVGLEWIRGLYVGLTVLFDHRGSQTSLLLAFFLTAHFSSHDYPYDWLMHWLAKVRLLSSPHTLESRQLT